MMRSFHAAAIDLPAGSYLFPGPDQKRGIMLPWLRREFKENFGAATWADTYRYCTAVEAMQRWLGAANQPAPRLEVVPSAGLGGGGIANYVSRCEQKGLRIMWQ